MKNQSKHLRRLTLAAMFAALMFVSIIFIRVDNPAGGIIHPADAVLYIAAIFLPLPYAMAAAVIGMAGANIAGFPGIAWAPATAIIKPLMIIFFTHQGKIMQKRNIIALTFAFFINVTGYTIANQIIGFNGLATLPGLLVQSSVATVLFVMLAVAMDSAKLKDRLEL